MTAIWKTIWTPSHWTNKLQDTDGDGKADETYKPMCCNFQTDDFEDPNLNSTFQWDLVPVLHGICNLTSNSGSYSLRSGSINTNNVMISLVVATEGAAGSFGSVRL